MKLSKSERRIRRRYMKKIWRLQVRAMKRENKISGQFMKKVVFAIIFAAFVFTVTMVVVFVWTGAEPSTLIENVFKFLSVEGGAMALIKSVKTVAKKRQNEEPEKREESEELSG